MRSFEQQPVVIKLSSLAVTTESGNFAHRRINAVLDDLLYLIERYDIRPVIVSSGAINVGRTKLRAVDGKSDMAYLQASAAVGQAKLMQMYQKKLATRGYMTAQLLLTHEDLRDKQRSLNIKNTLNQLIYDDIIPIINENDSVSFDEITFGDNDQLSAMICELVQAPLLVMLTKANGLYDRDPNEPGARRFKSIDYDQQLDQVKTLTKTITGKGGMKTKLAAVRKLTPLGIDVIISSYQNAQPLRAAISGEQGTFFHRNPQPDALKKRSWILTRAREHACVIIDNGAYDALLNNASLLPIGVKSVVGPFKRGDSVPIKLGRKVVAYGIVEYASKEADLICQTKSSELVNKLKQVHSTVLIHKDNLILKSA
jgi:glutamate 5-kinase